MARIEPDTRSPQRRVQDDEIAGAARLEPPDILSDATPSPMESHLGRTTRQPIALVGVVENGVVRLLDSNVKLPERARVIVVAERS
jgi:hypothetical protein